jgi:hypothetical protein
MGNVSGARPNQATQSSTPEKNTVFPTTITIPQEKIILDPNDPNLKLDKLLKNPENAKNYDIINETMVDLHNNKITFNEALKKINSLGNKDFTIKLLSIVVDLLKYENKQGQNIKQNAESKYQMGYLEGDQNMTPKQMIDRNNKQILEAQKMIAGLKTSKTEAYIPKQR